MSESPVLLSDLGDLEQLADGGQGRVYRVSARPDHLFKRYLPGVLDELNVTELGQLIARPATMTQSDQRYLREVAAWPLAPVVDGGQCVGFLMRSAPSRFSATLRERACLLELQYLLYPIKPMWRELNLPDLEQRRELAKCYARYFQVLHRYDVIVGDVSMRNFLWTLSGSPGIFALDCDSYRINGHHPALPQPHTQDWSDPTTAAGRATLDSDRYKLALLIIRLLLGRAYLTPHAVLHDASLRAGLDDVLLGLVKRAAAPQGRPHPTHWLRALEGRPTLTLKPPHSQAASANHEGDPVSPDSPQQRPRLPLARDAKDRIRPKPPATERPTIRFSPRKPPQET